MPRKIWHFPSPSKIFCNSFKASVLIQKKWPQRLSDKHYFNNIDDLNAITINGKCPTDKKMNFSHTKNTIKKIFLFGFFFWFVFYMKIVK